MRLTGRYRNWIYTKKEKLPVRGLYRQDAETEDGFLIRELANGQYGAYVQETLAGRAGIDEEGGLWTECFWTDLPEGEKVPVEKALWTFLSNLALEQGFTPYARLSAENAVSQNRLEELGFYGSKTELYCMEF